MANSTALDRIHNVLGSRIDSIPRQPCGCEDLPVGHVHKKYVSRKEVDRQYDTMFTDRPNTFLGRLLGKLSLAFSGF